MVADNKDLASDGEFCESPKGELVKIGPSYYGIFMNSVRQDDYMTTYDTDVIYIRRNDTFLPIYSIPTDSDVGITQTRFELGENPDFYDIRRTFKAPVSKDEPPTKQEILYTYNPDGYISVLLSKLEIKSHPNSSSPSKRSYPSENRPDSFYA